jgi:hypothetical protein
LEINLLCILLTSLVDFYKRIIGAMLSVVSDANDDGLTSMAIVPVIEGQFNSCLPIIVNSLDS